MSTISSLISHVSDTALLIAGCRAIESEGPDAFVRDPFAARLAGERGMAMFHALPHPEIMGFGIAIRSKFIDELLLDALASSGVATVVSVGCGLDTRPWRLELDPGLRWIEVDFAGMLDYKEELLAKETPRCRRERLVADLNQPAQRRAIYDAVGPTPSLMITEGLLMYLPAATVESLAAEAWEERRIAHWISEVTTTSFSKAIGGDGKPVVRHVQADDCLPGEQILETVYRHGWVTGACRSYITDLAFATERIARMMAGRPKPSADLAFTPNDPSGVHRFARGLGG
jgi:methyltransferase (TIGR00027 family)